MLGVVDAVVTPTSIAFAEPVTLTVGYGGAWAGEAEAEAGRRVDGAEMRSDVSSMLDRLMRPAVFGIFDGSTSVLSILLAYRHLDGLIFPGALALGAVGAVGMAAGEYLSDDTDSGLGASAVIGVATGLGTVAPAVPYLLFHGGAATMAALAVLLGIGVLIASVRARRHSWLRALAETYGVLFIASAAAVACTLAVPAGAG